MCFNEKSLGKKSIRNKFLIKLFKSPAIIAGSLEKTTNSKATETKTRLLSSNLNELCNSLNLLLPQIKAGIHLKVINGKIVGITGELLEYKFVSSKQHLKNYKLLTHYMFKLNENLEVDRRIQKGC